MHLSIVYILWIDCCGVCVCMCVCARAPVHVFLGVNTGICGDQRSTSAVVPQTPEACFFLFVCLFGWLVVFVFWVLVQSLSLNVGLVS